MNYIQTLGPLAIASRLKSLSDLFMRDMVRMYQDLNVDFEPRWFTFLHLISHKGPLSITHIALELNQTHPASNQVANALERKGYIHSSKDKTDHRKRIIQLTEKGKQLVDQLLPVWNAVSEAVASLLKDSSPGLMEDLVVLEEQLLRKPMDERIRAILNQNNSNTRITSYRAQYKEVFKSLNERWLKEFFEIEAEDARLLDNPEQEILQKGGKVYFALENGQVIGTCSLLRVDKNTCELTKMAVDPAFQGRGTGRMLLEHSLQKAREAGYRKMILLTSEQLDKALALYESSGFIRSNQGSLLQHNLNRCSIQLEINLTQ